MGNLTAVDQLNSQITKRLHDARVTVDHPAAPEGHWWIDVEHQGYVVSVEFRADHGFGVCGPDGGYGEGPDVVVPTASAAADYVVAFLAASRLRGEPPVPRELMRNFAEAVGRALEDLIERRLGSAEKELLKKLSTVSKDVKRLEAEVSELTQALLVPPARRQATPAKKMAFDYKKKQRKTVKASRSRSRR